LRHAPDIDHLSAGQRLPSDPRSRSAFPARPGRSVAAISAHSEGHISAIGGVERQVDLPVTASTGFQGTAQVFQDSLKGQGLLLIAAVLVIYMVLGVLYESFIHPLTILSGLPSAGLGALI